MKCQAQILLLTNSTCPAPAFGIHSNLTNDYLKSRQQLHILEFLPNSELYLCANCIAKFLLPFAKDLRHKALQEFSKADYYVSFCGDDFPNEAYSDSVRGRLYYLCSCGAKFDYFLDRMQHLDNKISHYPDGEIRDGKKVIRNEAIAGNPVMRVQVYKAPKVGVVDWDSFDEED